MKKYLIIGLAVVGLIISLITTWTNLTSNNNSTNVVAKAVFIDVRTDEEWAAGHLDGAEHLDVVKIQQGELPNLPKDTPIALYCRTGHRAGIALDILKQAGFTNVRNAGGLAELQSHGSKVCLGQLSACN